MAKVLLTGGSGFIATHVLDLLLERGFNVVITVRSESKGQRILDAYADRFKDYLSFVIVEDIAKDGAFDEAVISDPPFDYVVHTASPYHFNIQDPVRDFLDPAIKGTTGILRAVKAKAQSVKRVVFTSSTAAMVQPPDHPKVYSEEVWGSLEWEDAKVPQNAYRGSKLFAEKAAWEFMETEKPNFDLVVINPPLVFGPVVHYLKNLDSLNTSNDRIRAMLVGEFRDELPPSKMFIFVDVRDLAVAHVRVLEVPEAGGKRFFVVGGYI